jgi:hypothetical protein
MKDLSNIKVIYFKGALLGVMGALKFWIFDFGREEIRVGGKLPYLAKLYNLLYCGRRQS